MSTKKRVAYFYDAEIGNFYYGPGHPMKPHRIRMCHNLLLNYRLYEKMDVFRPQPASEREMTKFHADDYVQFLKMITPQNMHDNIKQLQRFNVGEDCPVFDGLYDFCQLSAGGSIGGAVKLNMGKADVAVNWAGGLHHAKKCEASGFCYVNDIVLAILELLKVHQRVLYVDIDIHHGDGVEEAFYTTDRVMTVSFHKYGEYFPGTGDSKDIGAKGGKYHAINFPLRDGIDDETYESIFKPIMLKIMEQYQPGAVFVQCGADSLVGDRLGTFNLSIKGHGKCVEYIKSFGRPVLVVGGGGYTIRNVARCWAYETAVCLDEQLRNELPYNDYYEYFAPDHHLHISPSNMENLNTPDYLSKIKERILENLRHVPPAPGPQVGGSAETAPRDPMVTDEADEEDDDPDSRKNQRQTDARVRPGNDYGPNSDDTQHQNRSSAAPLANGQTDHKPASPAQPEPLPPAEPTTAPAEAEEGKAEEGKAEEGKAEAAAQETPAAAAQESQAEEPKAEEAVAGEKAEAEEGLKEGEAAAESAAKEAEGGDSGPKEEAAAEEGGEGEKKVEAGGDAEGAGASAEPAEQPEATREGEAADAPKTEETPAQAGEDVAMGEAEA